MKGARAVAGGLLMLALVCAAPAVSAAQDAGSSDATTTTTAEPPATPVRDPVAPADTSTGPNGTAGNAGGGDTGNGDRTATEPTPGAEPTAVGVSTRSARAHASASASVTMGDNFFSPASVTVSVGDIVTWKNQGQAPHTATADDGSFDTGTVVSGQSGSHMFTKPGTFSYTCTIHPNMHGTVRVLSAGGSGGAGSGSGGGSGSDASSSSSATEAQAVASPDAAGSSTSLAATGMAAVPLALIGLTMLASGLTLRFRFSLRTRAARSSSPSPAITPPQRHTATPPAKGGAAGAVAIIGLALLVLGLLLGYSVRKPTSPRISSRRAPPRLP